MDIALAAVEGSGELLKAKQLNGKKLGELTREDLIWQADIIAKAERKLRKLRADAEGKTKSACASNQRFTRRVHQRR
jgi:hypothetical protein